ncbi:hypothetical protein DH2020_039286 [Rehmannia glutinosa]|uniref:U1-type domain-containing protein n=1 Tax=Rehmannia glutinosa TaxID=99300 RepID=A0ABR0UYF5_REHGL
MRDAILIEIEKEKIREEIIISEIVRRRVFEAQVRTDLMIERELALRRNADGFPIRPSEFDSPRRLSVLGTRADGSSVDKRITMSMDESKRLNGRPESGGFETLPFQKGAADLKIPEVKPVSEGVKEKHDVIFVDKPNENISGSKRKAVTPPPVVNASELPSSGGISNKKAKEEWSCAICSVSRTNLRAFNDHLQGKKHMSKVAALRAENAGKNCSIGFFPTEAGFTAEHLPFKKDNSNPDNTKKVKWGSVEKKGKNGDPEKKKYQFWCEMCKVGANCLKVMLDHEKGKKHVNRLSRSDRNGRDKIAVLVNHAELLAEDGKNMTDGNVVDETMKSKDTVKPEDHELVDIVVQPENHKLVDETMEVEKKGKNGDLENKKYQFWCEMCKVGANYLKVMLDHEKGKKHVKRLSKSDRNGRDKIAVLMNHAELLAEDGKNITDGNVVDETMKSKDTVKPKDHELVDIVVKPENHKRMDETKEEDNAGVTNVAMDKRMNAS